MVFVAAWLFLSLNDQGWQSNRLLSIGIGGGIGWVMMLNVWGVIWRIQKKLIAWTKDNAANGTPIPEQAKSMARDGIPGLARQRIPEHPDAVLHGSRQPLPDVWEVESRDGGRL